MSHNLKPTKKAKRDLDKIRAYAKDLGVSLVVNYSRKPKRGDAGYYDTEAKKIILFKGKRDSWKDVVLTALHELGHAVGHYNNGNDYILKKAFQCGYEGKNKTERAFAYKLEARDIRLMSHLHRELGIEAVSMNETLDSQIIDSFMYYYFLHAGKYPPRKRIMRRVRRGLKKISKRTDLGDSLNVKGGLVAERKRMFKEFSEKYIAEFKN